LCSSHTGHLRYHTLLLGIHPLDLVVINLTTQVFSCMFGYSHLPVPFVVVFFFCARIPSPGIHLIVQGTRHFRVFNITQALHLVSHLVLFLLGRPLPKCISDTTSHDIHTRQHHCRTTRQSSSPVRAPHSGCETPPGYFPSTCEQEVKT
jgi:hypothetical protein